MKSTSIAACILLALTGSASAQQQSQSQGMMGSLLSSGRAYGELGYSHLDIRGNTGGVSVNGHPGILRGIAGYELHPNLAAEAMLGIGVRDADIGGSVAGVPFRGDVKVRHMAGVFVKPKMQFGPVEVFARAGYVRTRVRATASGAGVSASSTDSDGDGAYGVGVNWQFSQRAYAGLDLMRYQDRGGSRIDGVTLSVGSRW